MVRVSGWSGPRTRSRSVRVCSYSGIASSRRPGRPVGVGEVVPGGQGVGVVGAEDPLAVGEGLLEQRDRLGQVARPPGRRRRGCCGSSGCRGGRGRGPARGRRGSARTAGSPRPDRPAASVGGGEVVAGGQGVGVVGAEDPLAVGEGAARSSGIASVQPARRLVGGGEVVAGGQGVGVVGAEHPLAVGEGLLVAAAIARPAAPPPGRRRRGCCGWSGCRGGRGRGPAPGR